MSIREPADLLIEARWLLPIAPSNTVHGGQAVAVSAGRIVAVGPAADLRARFEPRERVVRGRHALLPGLVNAHTCAAHALLRGLAVRAPRARWLSECVRPLERRLMSAAYVREGTALAMAAMVRAGITCFADLDLYPEEAARAAAAAHMRAAIALPVAEGASPWAEGATAHLARAERLWDEYRSDARISLYFAPLAPLALSDATLARVQRVADELDARVAVHLDELTAEPEAPAAEVRDGPPPGEATARRAAAALGRLDALGLLRAGFSAVGPSALGPGELELLGKRGATLIVCPQAQLRLNPGAVPALPFLPERTGLGTDSPLAAGAFDLLAEARTAALLAGLPAAAALRLATLGGATALGLAAQIGSVEPGKAADLICIELTDAADVAAAQVPDAIVFGATRAQVSDAWIAGRAALGAGRLLGFDERELAGLAQRWAERAQLEAA
ncbi:MAG TPA: amidohydrolase family protein [Steroidobacteraceae bacterium]|nr:amidohydrolase family protein [Steroidobacteraceae bacterium]